MKILKGLLAGLLALILLVFIFQEPLKEVVYERLTAEMFVAIDDDDFDPGIAVSATLPTLQLAQNGAALKSLKSFSTERGAAIYFVRSIDWCPYCIQQMRELEQVAQNYRDSGIGLVAITYDSATLQQGFVELYGISYPLLSDETSTSIKALGLLNEEHQPGDWAYGIPHPGVIFIDSEQQVRGKVFLRDYRQRVTATAVFELADQIL